MDLNKDIYKDKDLHKRVLYKKSFKKTSIESITALQPLHQIL